MTNQPSPAPRSKRVLSFVLSAIVITAILAAVIISNLTQTKSVTESQVIAAVRANFPHYCPNGQILTDTDGHNHWGIKCDTWLKDPLGFYGDVTIIDVENCTTIRPLIGTVGEYYNEYEAINESNGHKLAICP